MLNYKQILSLFGSLKAKPNDFITMTLSPPNYQRKSSMQINKIQCLKENNLASKPEQDFPWLSHQD